MIKFFKYQALFIPQDTGSLVEREASPSKDLATQFKSNVSALGPHKSGHSVGEDEKFFFVGGFGSGSAEVGHTH